mgnify:CR=1 FL=1
MFHFSDHVYECHEPVRRRDVHSQKTSTFRKIQKFDQNSNQREILESMEPISRNLTQTKITSGSGYYTVRRSGSTVEV